MSAPLSPQPPAPEALFPQRCLACCELVRCLAGVLGLGLVDPRTEIARGEIGECETEVREVALGVDCDDRKPCLERLFDHDDTETGLAGASHPDDHAVRRQLVRGHCDVARGIIAIRRG
jgi:hypothetical protein